MPLHLFFAGSPINPCLLMLPKPGKPVRWTNKAVCLMLLLLETTGIGAQMVPGPLPCANVVYQSMANGTNSVIISRNLVTGATDTVRGCAFLIHSLSYAPQSNMLYFTRTDQLNRLYRVGTGAGIQSVLISDLVAGNIAAITTDNYLVITSSSPGASDRYYVVDVNSTRTATFHKLVDPTSNTYPYPAKTAAPYHTKFSGDATINVGDIAFNPSNSLFYGVNNVLNAAGTGTDTNARKLVSFDYKTGVLSYGSAVTGVSFQNETEAFGSAYFDVNNNFYVFANTLGRFYHINLTSNAAAPVGPAWVPNNFNDGASCPGATIAPPATLPVIWGSIAASIEQNHLTVKWQTLSELNNEHFEIQASADGKSFISLGVLSSKAPGGTSETPLNYSFSKTLNDMAWGSTLIALLAGITMLYSRRRLPAALFICIGCVSVLYSCTQKDPQAIYNDNKNYFIRIAQVDADGTMSYSPVIKTVNR